MGHLRPKLEVAMAFVKGALNVEMSYAFDPLETLVADEDQTPITVYFPSETAKSGWFVDNLPFDSIEAAYKFFSDMELMIRIGRLQQREPHIDPGNGQSENENENDE